MRTIKFRGKIINDPNNILNGLWCYGNLDNHGESIVKIRRYRKDARGGVMVAVYQVEPETVGQFVGQYDEEGNEIYEGDIVEDPEQGCNTVGFYQGVFISENSEVYNILNGPINKVIGNIHDNPELLNS